MENQKWSRYFFIDIQFIEFLIDLIFIYYIYLYLMILKKMQLISSDGFEFIIDRRCALISGTIKSMLTGPGTFFKKY